MILAYNGLWVSADQLRKSCGVSRDGTTALKIVAAARSFGLVANGYKREPEDLRNIQLPFIIFWNFNHFLVVTEIACDFVYVNDPAVGRRKISTKDFDSSYTGVVLTFTPGPGFQKGGSPPRLISSFISRLSGSWDAFIYLLIISTMLVIPSVIAPAMVKIFIDQYLILGLEDWLRPIIVATGLTALIAGILVGLQLNYILRLQVKLSVLGGHKIFLRLLALPSEFFAQRSAADLNIRLQSIPRIASMLAGGITGNLIACVSIILYGAVMIGYSRVLAAVGLGYLVINLLAARLFYARRHDASRLRAKAQARVASIAVHALQHIETVKATGSERDLFERWSGAQAQYISLQQEFNVGSARLSAVPQILGSICNSLVLCIGAAQVINGRMTIGDMISFQLLFNVFCAPVQSLVAMATSLSQASADVARVDDVLIAPPKSSTFNRRGIHSPKSQSLEFRNVTFGFSRMSPPILQNISFRLDPGARIAIVGRSGCGKSTVLKIAAGLFEPWSGEVLIDGSSISALDPSDLASSIAVVDQDISFFGTTIKENITLWDETISQEAIASAIRDAEIYNVINRRAGGLLSQVAEGAHNFSGGEKQRLELARALVRYPSLLLLDEATSALDPIIEKRIDDNIRRRGSACLIAAHRLSTIRDCDEILVLDKGIVVERGPHDLLAKLGGVYSRLINAQ